MTTWQEFLVEHAKFPFPDPVENGSDVGVVAPKWRAKYAVPDGTLVQKLCRTLDNILEDTVLSSDGSQVHLLLNFGRRLQFHPIGTDEIEDPTWSTNGSECQSRMILNAGFFRAATFCLGAYGRHRFTNTREHVERGLSKVDYLGMIDGKRIVLVEPKSPSVMKAVGDSLPTHAFKLNWAPGESLISKVLLNAALHLGLREMEWLFLTCHNYWIICRLVSDDDNPFLAYSHICSIKDSSEPFRAFLGAILSVQEGASVQASESNPAMVLDIIPEEVDSRPSSEDDTDHGSGEYQGSSATNIPSSVPMTHSRVTTGRGAAESELMFTLSSPHYPESFQVWVHLHSLPNNTFVLPHCGENGSGKQRLWLTHHIGSGSTGSVWECRFDDSDDLFAIKVIELQRTSDVKRQQRFYKEFGVYLSLEIAYQSGQLRDRITPHCYGAFERDGTKVLILGLCGNTLNDWDELNFSELRQVYELVRDLHRVGIIHADLEPRNIARVPGGGFHLIDFSESVRHTCVEVSGKSDKPYKCPELQGMRKLIRRHPNVT
ncbi:kinase-like domain-containing protein [Lactarius sanguifluus]|nr:kinase-like domain-containing protein [Lactarius sanguifluus]